MVGCTDPEDIREAPSGQREFGTVSASGYVEPAGSGRLPFSRQPGIPAEALRT